MPQPVPLPLFDRDPMDVYDWLQHCVHVERWAAVGKDSSAVEVSATTRIYTDLPCLVVPASASDAVEFAQEGIEANNVLWFGPDPATGLLPVFLVRDRILGVGRPLGGRVFQVQAPKSEGNAEWVYSVPVLERTGG